MSKELTIVEQLNNKVASVIGAKNVLGFEKAYLIANATQDLKKLLNADYMKPIMAIQGSRLGFKTDKDKNGGYPLEAVKNCLIEAVLMGVQPHGNQFNIIAGNTYITKEGFGYLLQNYKGLSYEIIHQLPRINQSKTSAAVIVDIKWSINGSEVKSRSIEIPVKMNSFMGSDAVLGKATRKARAWLYNTITGSEVTDGDILDIEYEDVKTSINPEQIAADKEYKRVSDHIKNAKDLKTLEQVKSHLKDKEQEEEFMVKHLELSKSNN